MYSDCILVLQKEASFRNIDLPCEFCMDRMFHHTEHAEDSKDTKCPLCERESQSLFTYSHTSARTVCLSLGGVKANVLGQRRTVTEQMLLAECVTHSNLANFPAEICVQLSHGFASFNHFCVFKHLQMLEDRIVERNKEEKSTGVEVGGTALSSAARAGKVARPSLHPKHWTVLTVCTCAWRHTGPV